MKKLLLCLAMVLPLIAVGCFEDGDDGATGSSGPKGAPGQDALISSNSYTFTVTPQDTIDDGEYCHLEYIAEIDLVGLEAGWQTVTVWVYDYEVGEGTEQDPDDEWWRQLPYSETEVEGVDEYVYDYKVVVGEDDTGTYVEVEVLEDGAAYIMDLADDDDDYMVIVETFAH